jgi:hypothetical protein
MCANKVGFAESLVSRGQYMIVQIVGRRDTHQPIYCTDIYIVTCKYIYKYACAKEQ